MRARVRKWGNSLALRIPKALADAAGVGQGSEVEVTAQNGRLIAETVARVPTLEELVAGLTDENVGPYEDVPGALGNEAWPNDAPRGRERLDPWLGNDRPMTGR